MDDFAGNFEHFHEHPEGGGKADGDAGAGLQNTIGLIDLRGRDGDVHLRGLRHLKVLAHPVVDGLFLLEGGHVLFDDVLQGGRGQVEDLFLLGVEAGRAVGEVRLGNGLRGTDCVKVRNGDVVFLGLAADDTHTGNGQLQVRADAVELRDLDADKNAHDSGKQAQHETGRDEFQGKVARLLGARLRHLVLEGICG